MVFGSNGEVGKWLMGKKIGIYVTLLVSDSTKAFPHIVLENYIHIENECMKESPDCFAGQKIETVFENS